MTKPIEIESNRALARRESPLPVSLSEAGYTPEKLAIVKQTVADGLTEPELIFFLTFCRNANLDPFQKEVYAIPRRGEGGKRTVTFQTGIDALRRRAHETGAFAGMDPAEFGKPKQARAGQYTVTVPSECTFRVFKIVHGIRVPFEATARWDEYAPPLDKAGGFMWRRRPYAQIEKCAEALALRRAFQELRGLYAHEEFETPRGEVRELALPVEQMDPAQPQEGPQEAADAPRTVEARVVERPPERSVKADDWAQAIEQCLTQDEVMTMVPLVKADENLTDDEKHDLGQLIRKVGKGLPRA